MKCSVAPLFFVSLLVLGCAGEDESSDDAAAAVEIGAGPLAGTVAGQPWTMLAGDTDAFLSDQTNIWGTAYAEAISTCGGFSNSPEILLTIPRTVGDHALGLTLTATFYNPADSSNLGATKGHILVESITDTTVTGGAHIEVDANNTVNGRFTLNVCP